MATLNSIIICSRLNSRRVPRKALKKINGKPALYHLLDRLLKSEIPIILAVPLSESKEWGKVLTDYPMVSIHYGSADDPLKRMYHAATKYDVNHVIRITHDKIFINENHLHSAFDQYMKKALDYLYSSTITPGCGFEIISRKALREASRLYKKVEHISYAIKAITKNQMDMDFSLEYNEFQDERLLLDFPEDFEKMELIMAGLGNDCSQKNAFLYLTNHDWISDINKMPRLTIYTCAYNAEKWIEQCMGSVETQVGFKDFEYILIDDHSTDNTAYKMAEFASRFKNIKYIRNGENIGLASSSNEALKEARGNYIMRLDADDFLCFPYSAQRLLNEIETRDKDVIYPNNYFGAWGAVQKGHEFNHCGGAIFKTRAINHIKFTSKLRGHDSLDVFERAKNVLEVGYLNQPTFFYRQHDESLSKNDLVERKRIREKILDGKVHEAIQ